MYTQRLSKRSEYFKVLFHLVKYCFHKNFLKYKFQVNSQVCHGWRYQKFSNKILHYLFLLPRFFNRLSFRLKLLYVIRNTVLLFYTNIFCCISLRRTVCVVALAFSEAWLETKSYLICYFTETVY